MVLVFKKQAVWCIIAAIIVMAGGAAWMKGQPDQAVGAELDYRVFVTGLGTIKGKWSGKTGIAVLGVETGKVPEEGQELKVIDLLVFNGSSEDLVFNPDLTLIRGEGDSYGLKAGEQPEVIVRPGKMSQGTVIIGIPAGVPDNQWILQIKGGNLVNSITLPLRVVKARD